MTDNYPGKNGTNDTPVMSLENGISELSDG